MKKNGSITSDTFSFCKIFLNVKCLTKDIHDAHCIKKKKLYDIFNAFMLFIYFNF